MKKTGYNSRKQAVFLPIYLDENGKKTFMHYRTFVVEKENEKGEKVKKLDFKLNDVAKNEAGDALIKSMNRKARRMKASGKRKKVERDRNVQTALFLAKQKKLKRLQEKNKKKVVV